LSLLDHQAELAGKGCRVVVVAAGVLASGRKWLQDYALPVPLLVNPGKELYRLLGCRRSMAVWSLGNLIGYSEDKLAGVPPSPVYEGDDVHLMGGDYMTNGEGQLVFIYHSKTPRDRPTVEQIMAALDKF